jgi:hypothetical protein
MRTRRLFAAALHGLVAVCMGMGVREGQMGLQGLWKKVGRDRLDWLEALAPMTVAVKHAARARAVEGAERMDCHGGQA